MERGFSVVTCVGDTGEMTGRQLDELEESSTYDWLPDGVRE